MIVHQPARGIALALAAAFLFTISNGIARELGRQDYSVLLLGFCRAFFSLPLILLAAWMTGLHRLRTRRPGMHLSRALLGLVAALLFYAAVGRMPLVDAMALGFSAPLLITALSVPILGERVGLHRWSAVGVGFLAALFMLRPGSDLLGAGAAFVLSSVFCFSFVVMLIRSMASTEDSIAIVFWFSVIGTVVLAPTLAWVWRAPESAREVALLVGLGLTGGFGQILMTESYRRAPPAVIAPFDYSSLVWALIIGWAAWGEWPDPQVMAGAAVLVGCGLYILHRETRKPLATAEVDR